MSEAATPAPPPAPGQKLHPFEAILRMCAMTAPQPWYPRVYAQSVGMSREGLYEYLEHLWLDGLVQKAEGTPETGPGLTLTPAGRDVLDDPAALQRLKEGRPVIAGDRGGIVREVVRRSEKPLVSRVLLGANVAWFLYSVYLASSGPGMAVSFLSYPFGSGVGNIDSVLIRSGAIRGDLLLQGQWWRLATACFVHIGLLHLVMNMYFLFQVGKYVEQMWGRVRFLVIYAFAGLGGSCLSVALMPEALMAGASGALCGVIAAEAIWVLCNGKYLPRSLVSRWRWNLGFNALLLAGISVIHGVSWAGHLGGILTGAVVALILQAQRFGSWPWNWAALAALLPLPWLGYAVIQHERAVNPEWAQVKPGRTDEDRAEEERKAFEEAYLKRVQKETRSALAVYENAGVLDLAPDDRKPAEVVKVKRDLGEQREIIKKLAADLTAAGPYKDEATENARQRALRFAEALDDLLTTAEKRLREGTEWTAEDQAKNRKVDDAAKEWRKLLR
jgi:rhomboid protease GluP